jgi:single-stranded-DNA-specific exonuclease
LINDFCIFDKEYFFRKKLKTNKMINKWNIYSLTSEQKEQISNLAKELDISLIISQLLVIRGITTFEEARNFFRPSLKNLHNPFLMKDMDAAVARLNKALSIREKILVYGDYDVDGTTAVALVYGFLRQYTTNIGYYIPDRYSEGYGVSMQSIEFAKDNGYTLVIALDCGIKAVAKVQKAKEYGIDFIICDHHTPDTQLPDAVAVLDSLREDDEYPYRSLSGCGVGFKLIQSFCLSNESPFEKLLNYIDLVCVSIGSDIVPITGENRILASIGLHKLNNNPSLGLKSIIDVCSMNGKPLDISDVVFKVGPRINASGRMRTGIEVVELLTTNNIEIANGKCSDIDSYNTERREVDKTTTEHAKEKIINSEKFDDKKAIVIYNPKWNKGIVGIVASRLAEEFHKPTIVLTKSPNNDELVSGSARSVQGYDLYTAIESCRDLLDNFGGHLYAAGLSLKEENLKCFKERFEKYVAETILPEQLNPQINIDCEIDFEAITPKFLRILKQFNPFGPENMKPIFCSRNLTDYENKSRLIGKDSTHLRLVLTGDGKLFHSGVAFHSGDMRNYNMSEILQHLKNGGKIDICYTLEDNTFNGQTNTQLVVKDIKIVE